MKLVIDAGNSRIKWASVINGEFKFGGAQLWKERSFSDVADELWAGIATPSAIYVANVAGQDFARALEVWVKSHWNCKVEFLKLQLEQCGVRNQYATPFELGADRWADAIAAWHKYQHAVAIFDAGTSITLDIIDHDGNLLGGTITPGINLMINSLLKGANGLRDTLGIPREELRTIPLELDGKNTRDNILSGCILPAVAYLEYAAHKLQQKFGDKFTCLVVGGDSDILMSHLNASFKHHPYLVLEGVAIAAGLLD